MTPPAAFPASAFGIPETDEARAGADPFAGLSAVPASGRIEVVCLRPIHHPLEYEELYRLLAALRTRAPGAAVRLHLRSALDDLAPFRALPADEVSGLTERRGWGELAKGLRRLAAELPEDAAVIVLGRRGMKAGAGPARPGGPESVEARCGVAVGRPPRSLGGGSGRLRLVGAAPLTFSTPGCRDAEGEAAAARFRTALAGAMPRWRTAAGVPERIDLPGRAPRILIHQARFHAGDALWLTPLLAAIHRRFPHAAVTAVVPRTAAPLLADHPYLAELVFHDPTEPTPRRATLPAALDLERFAAVLSAFARRPESRPLAEAAARAGVPWRINLEYYDPHLDDHTPAPPFTHEGWIFWGQEASPRSLVRLLEPFGGEGLDHGRRVEPAIPTAAHEDAAVFLAAAGLADRPFAVLSPGGASSPRWPAERFGQLAAHLAADPGWGIVLSGSPAESSLLDQVAATAHAAGAPIPPRFTAPLDTLAALLARASLLVGNDSAPIHLAEAAGTPTLYFAQREKLAHSGPRHPECRALYDGERNDPRRIPVEAATAAARDLVRRWP
jgi:ADP-heptose:LPS heptosyltransferase